MIALDPEKQLIVGSNSSLATSSGLIGDVAEKLMRLVCLLALCSLLAVWTTGFIKQELTVSSMIIALLLIRGRSFPRARVLLHLLTLPVLAYAVSQYRGGAPGILILLQFTVIIITLQMLILSDGRAAVGAILLSMMIVLGVAAMNINFMFPIALLPYILVLSATLREMANQKHNNSANRSLGAVHETCSAKLRACFSGAIALLLFFSFWLLFFYIIPRTESFGIASEASRRRMQGFSDSLQIGSGGLLEDNPAVMLRIRPLEERTQAFVLRRRMQHRYLRGTSFYDYKEGSWSRSRARRWSVDLRPENGIMRFAPEDFADYRNIHAIEVIMENTDPPVVFVPDQAVSIEFDSDHMVIEDDKTVLFPRRNIGRRRYLAQMALDAAEVNDAPVDSIRLPPWQQFYLSRDGITLRLQELADDLASGTSTISQRVEAIKDFLHETTDYSLLEKSAGIMDPVEHFLFVSQSGTCEHYASAMALLLRAMDIPARPVSGFTMGEWNDHGKFFTVRQRHAHAWVEVFYPGHGWVPFDPTPEGVLDVGFEVSEGILRNLWEAYEGFWFTYVYNFDNQIQYSGFRRLLATAESYRNLLMHAMFNIYSVAIAGFLWLTAYVIRRRKKWTESAQHPWIPEWYHEWEARLSVSRQPWQTPAEFHAELFARGIISDSDLKTLKRVEVAVESCLEMPKGNEAIANEAKQVLGQLIV